MKIPDLNSPISDFMTTAPLRVEESATLQTALEVMHNSDIRHLPVTRKGELVGVISHRDITAKISKDSSELSVRTIKGVMKQNPYIVSPDTTLFDITREMVIHKYGSVIVTEEKRIVGIFTTIDAIRVLREVCGHKI